jgi:hypothetical protein
MGTTTTIEERRKDFLVHYEFFTPVELLFYKTLREKYPEMTVADIVVCRAAYIEIKAIGGTYEHLVERMLRGIWVLNTIPREEWARYVFENNKHNCLKPGIEDTGRYNMFQTEREAEEAIGLTFIHGYMQPPSPPPTTEGGTTTIQLRQDIVKLLDRTTEEAVQNTDYVSDEQLRRHEEKQQEQAEQLDRRLAAGLS